MSYIVLARKWRPQTFSDVVGQDHVTHTLKKAVEKGRLAHAYLFAGPRGCGKTTTARLLAKVINCRNPESSEPCNKCPSCLAVINGRHLDVIEIDGASNRGIDEIRDLRGKIGYSPSQGGSKIYIIDEVHMLTPQAFNALLKTLEEPPSHVYLVFATTEPYKVPSTILSRCQRFNFKRLELAELVGQLERICRKEKIKFAREALILVSRRAEGSMRDAEGLLDQCISASVEKIDLELVRKVLGLVDSNLVLEILGSIGRRDRKGALEAVDRVVSSGLDLEEFFLAYIEGLRNLLVLSVEDKTSVDWLDLTGGEIKELRDINRSFRTEDLLFLFRSAARSFREFKGASQPRYHLEAAIAEAASWESAVELNEILKKLDGMGGSGGAKHAGRGRGSAYASTPRGPSEAGGTTISESPRRGTGPEGSMNGQSTETGAEAGGRQPEEPVRYGGKSPSSGAFARMDSAPEGHSGVTTGFEIENALDELGGMEQWERFLAQVREAKLTLGIWLMSANVKGIKDDKLILTFSPQNRFACEMIREEKNKLYIESHLERFFGRKLIVEIGESGARETESHRSGALPEQATDPELEKIVEDAPMVKRLIDEFDGELFTEE